MDKAHYIQGVQKTILVAAGEGYFLSEQLLESNTEIAGYKTEGNEN